MARTEWDTYVTDRLRLHAEIDGEHFTFQLCGDVDGDWVDLVRYDTAHGEPHRHITYPDGTIEQVSFVAVLPVTFAGWVQRDLQEHAQSYYDEYLRQWGNMRGDEDDDD